MERDPVSGLYYPFYVVLADDWKADKTKEDGGYYETVVLLTTQSRDAAVKLLENATVNCNRVQLTLLEEHYDDAITLAHKVACEDGPEVIWY